MVRHGEEEVETMGLFKKSAIGSKPKLSIVVIFHNMTREAERTLYSLSPAYQEDVTADDYEIIAIDNGSNQPINPELTKAFGMNCVYQYLKTDSPSPAAAINLGVRTARGEYMALIVDGARMVTPGIISETLRALEVFKDPFVCTLGWHLGPDVQNVSMLEGYDQLVEDELLNSIEWLKNGYKLFEISTLAQSSHVGLLGGMPDECSWFAMRRDGFFELGGYEEQFQSPGGGLINHYFLNRVIRQEDIQIPLCYSAREGVFTKFTAAWQRMCLWSSTPLKNLKKNMRPLSACPMPRSCRLIQSIIWAPSIRLRGDLSIRIRSQILRRSIGFTASISALKDCSS